MVEVVGVDATGVDDLELTVVWVDELLPVVVEPGVGAIGAVHQFVLKDVVVVPLVCDPETDTGGVTVFGVELAERIPRALGTRSSPVDVGLNVDRGLDVDRGLQVDRGSPPPRPRPRPSICHAPPHFDHGRFACDGRMSKPHEWVSQQPRGEPDGDGSPTAGDDLPGPQSRPEI